MNNGLYTAATALSLNQRRMDVISSNIANANTTGYKKDLILSESFPEMLMSKINSSTDLGNFKPFKGVNVEKDGDTFNLNVQNGFFKVETSAGTGFLKSIKFTVDEEGYLKTFYKGKNDRIKTDGKGYILGKNGRIRVENNDIDVDSKGNVVSNGQVVDNLIAVTHPNVIGTSGMGSRLDRIATNFEQGNLTETGNDLDFALKGEGFFKVQKGDETLYTRDGSFTLNPNGELITTEGYFVVGQYGSIIVDGDDFTVNRNGEIIKDGEVIDKLDIIDINNPEDLRKQGNGVYKIADGINADEIQFQGETLRGYLESSNVNSIKEMTNMIALLRNYESSQKIIKAVDELLGKAVSEIGRV